jgi:peptidyl-prolyl cis-trans isomerase D
MLQAIRTRAGSIVVKVLFGLLILSFGLWGIYTRSDYFQGHSPETVIATVGDHDIRAEDLDKILQPTLERLRAQFGGAIDQKQLKQLGLLDSLLDRLINLNLLDQEAARLRLDVSDQVVNGAILSDPSFRGADGQFNPAQLQQYMMAHRLSQTQLLAQFRQDIPRSALLHAITVGISAPRPVAEVLFRYYGEKRLADMVALPLTGAGDVGQPSEADLAKFYEAHQDLFRAPEFRSFAVASLAPADLPKAEIPEDKLRQEYEQRKDEFETPEQRQVQQILASSEEKAKEAAAAIAAGKDWKEVATTIAGQAADAVELGLVRRQDLPPALADAVFELPLDQVSQPIKTRFGWHILRVVKIEPPATLTFEQAKPQLEAELQQQEAADRIAKIAHQIDDALAGGASLADTAAKFGLKVTNVAAADLAGYDPDGKPITLPVTLNDVVKIVFLTGQGETSQVLEAQDGAIFAIHVDKVMQPHVQPLAEVKDKAITAWQEEQKRAAVTKQADALAAAVKPDMPVAKIAADQGLTVTTLPPLMRGGDPGAVPPELIAKLFAAKPGEVVGASDASGAYVAQLKEIQAAENPPPDAAIAALSQQLANQDRAEIIGAFIQSLRDRYPVHINRDALDHMFGG